MLKYPLFILSKDDKGIIVIDDEKGLNYFEQIDVENDEYAGWDFDAFPLRVSWNGKKGIAVEREAGSAQHADMKRAIFNHIDNTAARYRPDQPFYYDRASDDFLSIRTRLREHIKQAPIKQKIVNFFYRF